MFSQSGHVALGAKQNVQICKQNNMAFAQTPHRRRICPLRGPYRKTSYRLASPPILQQFVVFQGLAFVCSHAHGSMMKLVTSLSLVGCLATAPAFACDTALALTIDVSNSVDVREYRMQIDGMADALQDPEIVEAMVQGEVAITVIQWSGEDKQDVSIPWTRIRTALDAEALAAEARLISRAFVLSDTAPAEAILFSLAQFDQVSDCKNHVIDVSGDGTPNSGTDVRAARIAAERQGVTINAIAIESMGLAITGFFSTSVITRNGFVITARTHREYPEAIRKKIIRELAQVLG